MNKIVEFMKKFDFKKIVPDILALCVILFFSIAYLRLAFQNYHYFETGIDLGAYSQALFNLSHFRLPFDTFKNMVMWGDHAHFIITLMAPLYRIIPDARLILVVQALAVTTAGWALYKISQSILKNSFFSLAILYSYLAFIGTQYALNVDFHPSVLTGAAIVWFFYGIHFEKRWIFWTAFILGLMTREDAPPIFFLIGLYLLFTKKWRKSFPIMIISFTYFCIVAYWIMPMWTKGHAALTYLDLNQRDPYHVIRNFVLYPKVILENMFDTSLKVRTIKTLFASFGYLSLFSPMTYISSISIFFSRFASPNEYRWVINNYSNANILPILSVGAIYGVSNIVRILKKIKLEKITYILVTCFAVLLVYSVQKQTWSDTKAPLYFSHEKHNMPDNLIPGHDYAMVKAKELIPADASISVSSGFTARLANRKQIQNYPDMDNSGWLVVSAFANAWPFSKGEMKHELKVLQGDKNFKLVWYKDGAYIFKRTGPIPGPKENSKSVSEQTEE